MKKSFGILAATAVFTLADTGALADTVTYKGRGMFESTHVLLPLANGAAAVQMTNSIVATIDHSDFGFMFGECAGLGYLDADGKLNTDAYCTFHESTDDGFDLKASLDRTSGRGSVKIIGGSGKWEGATGTGSVERKHVEGNRGSFEYEFNITTP